MRNAHSRHRGKRVFTPEAFQIVGGGRSEAQTGSLFQMIPHAEGVQDIWHIFESSEK
jgi:hypothetical protein